METQLLADRYELRHLLGRGGMAHVYYARDTRLQRAVAVKILRPEFARDAGFRERFHAEATAAARLAHPNIVTVYDFGEDDGRLFIVMEYIPGQTLRQIIDTRAPLPLDEAFALSIQACAGLGYAHRVGLVHGDVKPQNFLVMPDGRLKVTDFGLARAWHYASPAAEPPSVLWGTPRYLSPEQAAGKPPIPASDVYALGIVLYEMLTHRFPFIADDPETLLRLHREAYPIPPHRYRRDLPQPLEAVLLKVLSKEPSARYRTADQLGRVLVHLQEEILAPPAQAPSPAATPPPAEEPIDWLTAALALAALAAVGGLVPLWVWVYLAYHAPR